MAATPRPPAHDPRPAYDRLTRLAADLLRAPTALLFVPGADGPVVASAVAPLDGGPALAELGRQLLASPAPMRFAAPAPGLGHPVHGPDGSVIGALCVLGSESQTWTDADAAWLADLAALAQPAIELDRRARHWRKAEERLRLLESVAANAHDAILVTEAEPVDLPGPRIVYVNEAFTRMTGYTAEEVIGQTPRILQGPKTDRAQLDRIRKALKRWRPVRVELTNYRKDGTEFGVEFIIVPIADETGWFTHWVSIQRDVTERKRAEAALRESEERYRSVVAALAEGIVVLDAAGAVVACNPSAERILGLTADELLGRTPRDPRWQALREDGAPFPGDEHPAAVTLRTGAPQTDVVMGVARPDAAEPTWISITTQPLVRPGEDRPYGAVASFIDLTERRRAAQALRQTEQFNQAILDALSAHIAVVDRHGDIIAVNQAWDRFGCANGAAAPCAAGGRNYLAVCRAAAAHGSPEAAAVADGIRRVLEGETPHFTLEYPCHSPTEQRWFLMSVTAFQGRGAVVSHLNVTERKLAEEQVRRQTALLQSILDNISDGVIVADRDERFLVFNPAAARMHGRGACPLPSTDWAAQYGLFLPDRVTPLPHDQLPLRRAVLGESFDNQELCVRHPAAPDGRWVSVDGRPLRGADGAAHGGVIICRDVTERRRNEQELVRAKEAAEAANRAKSEFLSRMSHELRTPLNAILGFGQLLEMEPLDADGRESVEQIIKGGRHLLGLINEVLDIARIETGNLALSIEDEVHVDEVLGETVAMIQPLAAQAGIELRPPAVAGWVVRADLQRLKQVLLNLLANAVKYNRPGGAVTVGCAAAGGRLRIAVTDTGPGIAADKLARLFTPFDRLGAERSAVEGTGLGLALSRALVEAMQGALGVDSAVGRGSTFWVELPVMAARPDVPDAAALLALPGPAAAAACTVLYIEDNPANFRLVERILGHRPHVRLLSAMQGRLGLDLARQHRPDLIFLDLHLPDVGGDEVLARLRADAHTRDIPVTVVSADATPSQVDRLRAAGARGYLTKPINVKEFLRVLDDTIAPGRPAGEG